MSANLQIKGPITSDETLYKAYSLDSNRIMSFGSSELICLANSPPILPPAPVIKMILFFIWDSEDVLCTFCLRQRTSSIAIGFVVN